MKKQLVQLNKYLSSQGIASRRKVDEMIRDGRVKVNGQIILKPGPRIDPVKDKVEVDGMVVGGRVERVYIMLNKPKGIISSVSDENGRKTVVDLVKNKERIYPVGRLDENSTGLILLTNDGEMANKLTHPKFEIPKTYQVLVDGNLDELRIKNLESGIVLKEGKTAPAKIKILGKENRKTRFEITIYEGRNHQVKRMLSKVGLNVLALKRVSIGPLKLGNLKPGEYRFLSEVEIKLL